jgi:hypothetical protein
VGHGGAPAEDDSFMIDFNWAYPFSVGNQDFSIEGHRRIRDTTTVCMAILA